MQEINKFDLVLIRHGQSEVNVNPDRMGQLDTTPLTALGCKQAHQLNLKFIQDNENFDIIYSSPYSRAYNTAKIAVGNLKSKDIIIVPELREYDAGDWVGASRKSVVTDAIKLNMGYFEHGFLPPNGESLHQVERRASEWLEQNILYNKNQIKKDGQLKIAIFSHGMTIKCLLHYIMGFDRNITWKIAIDNTSVTRVSFGNEGWRIQCINDTSHLYKEVL